MTGAKYADNFLRLPNFKPLRSIARANRAGAVRWPAFFWEVLAAAALLKHLCSAAPSFPLTQNARKLEVLLVSVPPRTPRINFLRDVKSIVPLGYEMVVEIRSHRNTRRIFVELQVHFEALELQGVCTLTLQRPPGAVGGPVEGRPQKQVTLRPGTPLHSPGSQRSVWELWYRLKIIL